MLQNLRKIGPARWKLLQSMGRHCIRTNSFLSKPILDQSKKIQLLPLSSFPSNIDINLRYCSNTQKKPFDRVTFERVCSDTLDSLTAYFEELVETSPHLKNADVSYSEGVLTVQLGKPYGTYVINRQTPNLQIWLSSPISGPKRYDFINESWVYRHDNSTLHALLNKELEPVVKKEVDFVANCSFGKCKSE